MLLAAAVLLSTAGEIAAQGPVASNGRFPSGTVGETPPYIAPDDQNGEPGERIIEPQGCDCSQGTIWIDPLPDDFRHPAQQMGPPADPKASFLDRLRGHGPIGMVQDPLAVPTGLPAECDEIDVGPDTPWDVSLKHWWTRDLEVFGGIQGFRGAFDRTTNGNFGINEGFNFGAPLGIFDWGWQIGAEATQSNLTGANSSDPESQNRNQFFVTGGIFKRAREWGCQWGVVYDWLHDVYFLKADLKQIRSDSSFLFPGGVHEVGYFGAYGTGGQNYVLLDRNVKYFIYMEPTDVFALYYRRYFDGGGDGRIWLGWTGNGAGVLGGEIRVPMGKSWELQNRFNYLIPKQGNGGGAESQESWGVSLNLVWYIGHPAGCERYHPYRPFLNVADNTLFMTDTFVPANLPAP
jgi:hypothetical protein